MMRARWMALLAGAGVIAGCGGGEQVASPVEVVAEAAVSLRVEAQGEVRSAKATPLQVPGQGWSQRQLEWMLPEGTQVKKDELVARFASPQGALELTKAELDLRRNVLARMAKEQELTTSQDRVGAEMAKVDVDLAIAERYADADTDLGMFARNQILDAVQDAAFLGVKRDTLQWQRGHTDKRGDAEMAVLESQRATYGLNAERRKADVASLELRAPHEGVFTLSTDWGGEKPKVGASMWAGQEFGALPELASLEVQFALTQLDAQGVKVGAEVDMHPLGRPDQAFKSTVSWVAGAAQARSRQSPVKYVMMRATIPAEAVKQFRLVPGQGIAAEVFTRKVDKGVSVPNVALISEGDKTYVEVRQGSDVERRVVELGERGTARSEVTAGLKPGDAVVLTPLANATPEDAKRFSAPGAAGGGRGGRGGGGQPGMRRGG
jgi:HlyD family secretion protein